MSIVTPHWLEPKASHLIGQLRDEQLGHALLIQGPIGVGKHWLADQLSNALACTQWEQTTGVPCGQCQGCQLYQNGTHPDCFYVEPPEAGHHILVDQVRELIAQLMLTPSVSRYRVGILTLAESMTEEAANALLKTLEEPPNDVWLLLVSHSPQNVLPTIRSRCQGVVIAPPAPSLAMNWLQEHHPDGDQKTLELALRMSSGAPLLALEKLTNGLVETADEVLERLHALASGSDIQANLDQTWGDDASTIWPLLAFWVSELARAPHEPSADPRLIDLSNRAKSSDWSSLWSAALNGVSLVGSGRRHDLLMTPWLLDWTSRFKT